MATDEPEWQLERVVDAHAANDARLRKRRRVEERLAGRELAVPTPPALPVPQGGLHDRYVQMKLLIEQVNALCANFRLEGMDYFTRLQIQRVRALDQELDALMSDPDTTPLGLIRYERLFTLWGEECEAIIRRYGRS